jgi:hypothetical protein
MHIHELRVYACAYVCINVPCIFKTVATRDVHFMNVHHIDYAAGGWLMVLYVILLVRRTIILMVIVWHAVRRFLVSLLIGGSVSPIHRYVWCLTIMA